jgi:hypothetical protein
MNNLVNNNISNIAVGLLNAQLISRKSVAIADTVTDRSLDVLVLTKTYYHANEDLSLRCCAPPGYSIVDATRQEARVSHQDVRGWHCDHLQQPLHCETDLLLM